MDVPETQNLTWSQHIMTVAVAIRIKVLGHINPPFILGLLYVNNDESSSL